MHIAAVYDSDARTVKLYRDGRPDGAGTYTNARPAAIGPGRIGMWNDQPRPFHGSMDDLRIYDRALGDDEIRALAGM